MTSVFVKSSTCTSFFPSNWSSEGQTRPLKGEWSLTGPLWKPWLCKSQDSKCPSGTLQCRVNHRNIPHLHTIPYYQACTKSIYLAYLVLNTEWCSYQEKQSQMKSQFNHIDMSWKDFHGWLIDSQEFLSGQGLLRMREFSRKPLVQCNSRGPGGVELGKPDICSTTLWSFERVWLLLGEQRNLPCWWRLPRQVEEKSYSRRMPKFICWQVWHIRDFETSTTSTSYFGADRTFQIPNE